MDGYVSADDSWAETIVDGEAWFQRIYDAILTCTSRDHCIYLTGWAIGTDFRFLAFDKSTSMIRVLAEKAAAGVDVRVLLYMNPLFHRPAGESRNPPWLQALMRSAAVNRARADAQGWGADVNLATARAMRTYEIRGRQPLRHSVMLDYSNAVFVGSHHIKLACIYGGAAPRLRAFCGGIDFGNEKFARRFHARPGDTTTSPVPTVPISWPAPNHWHDLGVLVTGPAAVGLWETFGLRWSEAVGVEQRERLQFIPWFAPPGTAPEFFNPDIPGQTIRASTSLEVVRAVRDPGVAPELQVLKVARCWHPIRGYSPRRQWATPLLRRGLTEFSDTLAGALRAAQHYIYIEDQDPFLVFAVSAAQDRQVLNLYNRALQMGMVPPIVFGRAHQPWVDAIAQAIRAHPNLRVIFVTKGGVSDVQNEPRNQVRPELAAFAAAYPRNVGVFLLQRYFPHAKLVLIDDYFFSIGSANFSTRSAIGIDTECTVMGVAGDRSDGRPNTPKALRMQLWSEHFRQDLAASAQFANLREALGWFVPAWGRGAPRVDLAAAGILRAYPDAR